MNPFSRYWYWADYVLPVVGWAAELFQITKFNINWILKEVPSSYYITFDFATWNVINRGTMVIKKSQVLQVWDKMTWFLLYWVDHTPRRAINCQLSLKSRRISSTCTFVAHFVFCVGRHSFETDGQRRVWCSYCLLIWATCRRKIMYFVKYILLKIL